MLGESYGVEKIKKAYELREKGFSLREIEKELEIPISFLAILFKKYPKFEDWFNEFNKEHEKEKEKFELDEKSKEILKNGFLPLCQSQNIPLSTILEIALNVYKDLPNLKSKIEMLEEENKLLKENVIQTFKNEIEQYKSLLEKIKTLNVVFTFGKCVFCDKEVKEDALKEGFVVFCMLKNERIYRVFKNMKVTIDDFDIRHFVLMCDKCFNNFLMQKLNELKQKESTRDS